MNNFEIMRIFQHFPFGSQFIDDATFSIVWNKTNTSYYENYALIDAVLSSSQLQEIQDTFMKIERKSAIYFENRSDLERNKTFLKNNHYDTTWSDSWLFYENKILYNDLFTTIREVKTPQELELFLQTFDACYQKNDPQNPYGEVKEYLHNSRERWMKYHQTDQVRYFIGYDNQEPVAVAALTTHNNLGYISAVGSLQKVRGKGFGKNISLFAVYTSQQMGNTKHFLLTEVGMYPYEFYKRIGFGEKFTSVGYSKS